ISVPFGSGPEGLPLGTQLIAGPWNEALLLRAARALEDAGRAGRHRPVPNPDRCRGLNNPPLHAASSAAPAAASSSASQAAASTAQGTYRSELQDGWPA